MLALIEQRPFFFQTYEDVKEQACFHLIAKDFSILFYFIYYKFTKYQVFSFFNTILKLYEIWRLHKNIRLFCHF